MRSRKARYRRINFWVLWIIASLLCALISDLPDFLSQPMDGVKDAAINCLYFGIIVVVRSALIALMALNSIVFAIFYPILLILSAVMAYFFITLDVVLSPTIIGLTFGNDLATSADFITLPLVFTVLAAIALSVVMVILRLRFTRSASRPWIWTISAVAIIIGAYSVPRVKNMLEARMPFSLYMSVRDYLTLHREAATERHTFDATPATADADSLTVVMVIGESLRADRLSLNGYQRTTTPSLDTMANLVSLPNIASSAFHTAISIPRIMTRANDDTDSLAYEEQSFIPLFRKAGFRTSWIANQEPLPSFIYFTTEADTLVNTYLGHSHYHYDAWLDSDMLAPLDDILGDSAPRRLIILHTIGNHWWFRSHYTEEFARWKPELTSRNIRSCTHEQIVNSYDNATLCTDSFLAAVIDRVRGERAMLIYLSDHGEGLGDDGRYLHATPNAGTRTPAAFIWLSDSYIHDYPGRIDTLRSRSTRHTDTGFLFHTILDGAGIATPVIDPAQSMLR